MNGCSKGSYLQTDAYQGYNYTTKQYGMVWALCMAHARRKFYDVTKLAGDKKKGLSHEILDLINKLYDIERECKANDFNYEQIHQQRQKISKPIFDKIQQLIEDNFPRTIKGTAIYKALYYFANNSKGLGQFIDHGILHIDNNLAEQGIKAFVTGRKNWLFCGNEKGAKSASIIFSVLQTAQRHGIHPDKYLEWVLTNIPDNQNINDLLPTKYIKNNLAP